MRDWLGEAKAKQVYLVLRDRILSGAISFGARLPTGHELADLHGVSRVTVRRALGELARERLIERRRSAGGRVIYHPARAPITDQIVRGVEYLHALYSLDRYAFEINIGRLGATKVWSPMVRETSRKPSITSTLNRNVKPACLTPPR